MNIDRPVMALVASISMAINVWLLTENSALRDRVASVTVTREQISSVAEACHGLVAVNRRCLAFGQRVKEFIDDREDKDVGARWVRAWDDEVLRGTGGADKAGARSP